MSIDINKYILENSNLSELQIRKLNEDSKSKVSDKIVTKLYKCVKKKSSDVDFPMIEKSRGNVDALPFYKDLRNSIRFLGEVGRKSNVKSLEDLVRELETSLQLLIDQKKYFVKGFRTNNLILKNCYIGVVGMVVQVTAYAIVNCIDFKNNGVMFEAIAIDCKRLKIHRGYQYLKEINDLARQNKLVKVFGETLSLTEAAVSLAWMGAIMLLLTSLRGIFHLFLSARVSMAEYLDTIKNFVELNAANVRDPKIKQKQQKWVDRLEKLRDKISLDQQIASSRIDEELEDERIQFDSTNDSIGNDLGLL